MFPSSASDIAIAGLARGAASIAAGLCVCIAGYLVIAAWPALVELGPIRFFDDPSWHPSPGATGSFDLVPALVGTMLAAVIATLVVVPLGVGAALGAVFIARPWVGRSMNALVGVLAGVPSVVVGLWGLTTIVPCIATISAPGTSLLAAAMTLGVMIVPTVYVATHSALLAVPRSTLDAAEALGLSRWGAVRGAVIPALRPAIVLGTILALVRAVGETMAVVMVAGNVAAVPGSLLDPVRTLTGNIALELGYATGLHRAALFASGVLLLIFVWGMVVIAGRFGVVRVGVGRG